MPVLWRRSRKNKRKTKPKGECAYTCLKKRSFYSEEEALQTMQWLKTDKGYSKLKRAYNCPMCGKWHLTKKEAK